MTEQVRTIYRCGFCKKYGLSKKAILKHEQFCGVNPANKHVCFSCSHLTVDQERNDDGFSEKTFTCALLGNQMHSYKAEKIGHSCLSYTDRMPLLCGSYKSHIEAYFNDNNL